jgi:hypothetical protein
MMESYEKNTISLFTYKKRDTMQSTHIIYRRHHRSRLLRPLVVPNNASLSTAHFRPIFKCRVSPDLASSISRLRIRFGFDHELHRALSFTFQIFREVTGGVFHNSIVGPSISISVMTHVVET